MRELERKQLIKRRLYSTPAIIGLLFLTIFLARGASEVLEKRSESIKHLEDLDTKTTLLVERQVTLEKDIERLKTSEGINEEIKEKFSVSEAGERVAIIVDEKPSSTTTEEIDKPWYVDVLNTIKSLWQ